MKKTVAAAAALCAAAVLLTGCVAAEPAPQGSKTALAPAAEAPTPTQTADPGATSTPKPVPTEEANPVTLTETTALDTCTDVLTTSDLIADASALAEVKSYPVTYTDGWLFTGETTDGGDTRYLFCRVVGTEGMPEADAYSISTEPMTAADIKVFVDSEGGA